MAKHIMQFRYYKDKNEDNLPPENNQPKNITMDSLVNGSIFQEYLPFTQLGIQALPGTRFYLNNNIEGPVIIGSTGIYELELDGISKINNLWFERKSLELIANNNNASLIIDVIYEN